MNWLRCVMVLLLGTAGLAGSPGLRAETTCSATMSNLEFGLGNTTTAVIDYQCTTRDAVFSNRADVSMCFAIGAGSSPGSTVTQRRMSNGFNDPLGFVIHKTASNPADNWGGSAPTHYVLDINYGLTGFILYSGTTSGQIVVHGRIPSRNGVAPGDYSSRFNDTDFDYRYRDSWLGSNPSSCNSGGQGGGTGTFPFTARAKVPGSCSVVTASDMSFNPGGMPLTGTRTGNLVSTSTIDLTCTRRTTWQVGLDDGLHATPTGVRQMCNADGACIAYRLNKPDGNTPWGDDVDLNTVEGTSAGSRQSLTVHGRVADQPLQQAGRYSDTVKVVLTY